MFEGTENEDQAGQRLYQRLEGRPGDVIRHSGQGGDALYFIRTGLIEVVEGSEGAGSERDPQCRPTKRKTLRAGQFFGEMALGGGSGGEWTVRVVEAATLLRIDGPSFDLRMRGSEDEHDCPRQGFPPLGDHHITLG